MRYRLLALPMIVFLATFLHVSTANAAPLLHIEHGGVWATVTPLKNKYYITWVNTNERKLQIEYVETFSTGKSKTRKVTLKPHQQLQDKHHRSKDLIVSVLFKSVTIKD